jgi:hypothetical protein
VVTSLYASPTSRSMSLTASPSASEAAWHLAAEELEPPSVIGHVGLRRYRPSPSHSEGYACVSPSQPQEASISWSDHPRRSRLNSLFWRLQAQHAVTRFAAVGVTGSGEDVEVTFGRRQRHRVILPHLSS